MIVYTQIATQNLSITSEQWRRGSKNRQGQKLQFFHRHCKFLTEFWQKLQIFDRKDYGCSTPNFSSKISLKMEVFSPKFGIFKRTFSDEKIFDNFLTVKNLRFATAPITIFPLGMMPQLVNRIKILLNRIGFVISRIAHLYYQIQAMV